jgi:hypothetical protein
LQHHSGGWTGLGNFTAIFEVGLKINIGASRGTTPGHPGAFIFAAIFVAGLKITVPARSRHQSGRSTAFYFHGNIRGRTEINIGVSRGTTPGVPRPFIFTAIFEVGLKTVVAPLQAAVVKAITGGDTLTSRANYGKQTKFRPTWKSFMVTNDIPMVSETTTDAIWRRMRVILFEVRFVDDPDPGTPWRRSGTKSWTPN